MPFAIKPSKLCLILVTEVGQKARLVLYAVTVHQKKKKKSGKTLAENANVVLWQK